MNTTSTEIWGNIELPGFSDNLLLNPNLNKILANREKMQKGSEVYEKVVAAWTEEKRAETGEKSRQQWEDDEYRNRVILRQKQRWINNEEQRQQVIEWASQSKDQEHRANISKSLKEFYQTEQGRAVIEKQHSNPNTRKKISDANKGVPKPRVTCPHCQNSMPIHLVKRWNFNDKHFDNCPQKPNP